MSKREIRAALPAELRQDGDAIRVIGHAAIFNERASIAGMFDERIAPGAFDAALAASDVPFLIEHQGLPLARTGSGTLKLSVDDRGLLIETDLDGTDPDVARIVPKMKRGDLSKMSFAFTVAKEEWDDTGAVPLRTITEFDRLYDVAIVANPAYAGTDIGLRSLDAHRAAIAPAPDPEAARTVALGLRLRLTA